VLFVEPGANGYGGIRIHRAVALLHVLNDSAFIHNDCGAVRPLVVIALLIVLAQNSIGGENLPVHIAEERERDADGFCKGGVGGGTVNTDSQHLRVAGFELGLISLIGLKFLRSTAGECQDVKCKHHIFLAAVVAQLYGLPLVAQ
jgi:hypothetical protein